MGWMDNLANTLSGRTETSLERTTPVNEEYDQRLAMLDSFVKQQSPGTNNAPDGSVSEKMSPVGLDAIIQDWVRQQFIYRRSILQDLYIMAFQVTEIRSALLSIKREVFRKGFGEWVQKFVRSCPNCEKKYDESGEGCDECFDYEYVTEYRYTETGDHSAYRTKKWKRDENGNKIPTQTRMPDLTQQNRFDTFLEDANTFHQPLLNVLMEFFDDVMIADDGFLLINKEYELDRDSGEIFVKDVFEITRLHPALVEFDIDRKDGLPERSHYICLLHRNEQINTGPGGCAAVADDGMTCGAELYPALYRYYWRGRYRYYTRDEIFHASFFAPSKTYGYSPVLTIFEKILTLTGLDRTYYRYFYERRIPPGVVISYTDDPESLETEIERIKMQMLQDPNTFPWIAAASKSNRGRTDHIRLGYTFEELDILSVRQEIRERIAMLWGVTPMYQGDSSSVGGLTRETAQTSMFENLVESYQNIINRGVIPFILKSLGITDWEIQLTPPLERTEEDKLRLDKQRIENAQAMINLGYTPVKTKGVDIKFTYEKAPQAPMGMPGMDPMGGAMGMPPPPMGPEAGGMPPAPPPAGPPAGGMPPPPPPG